MLSPMTVRLPAVAVAVAVVLPMAVATVVAVEPPLRCATTRATAVLVRQLPPPFVPRRPPQWWKKWLLNRCLKRQPLHLRSRRCLQAAPVVAVQRPADRAKALLILLINPTDSVEPMGLIERIKGLFVRSAGR